MVNRLYICDNCEFSFEIQQKLHDKLKKKCPNCKKNKLYQDLTGQYHAVRQEPKTIGHAAARNTEEMGKYQLEAKRHAYKTEKEKKKLNLLKSQGLISESAESLPKPPWYNPDNITPGEINKMTKKQKRKYVIEGKK